MGPRRGGMGSIAEQRPETQRSALPGLGAPASPVNGILPNDPLHPPVTSDACGAWERSPTLAAPQSGKIAGTCAALAFRPARPRCIGAQSGRVGTGRAPLTGRKLPARLQASVPPLATRSWTREIPNALAAPPPRRCEQSVFLAQETGRYACRHSSA